MNDGKGKLKTLKNEDVLDIGKVIEGYEDRISKGDNSIISTDIDSIKEEKKESSKGTKRPVGRNSKYSGPLQIQLDEFDLDDYSDDIWQFKEFFDGLGNKGVTFEYLFSQIEKYNKETGKKDVTVSKIKSKLYQMNSLNTISLVTIRDISRMLGYSMHFEFTPLIKEDMFDGNKDLKDL